MSFSDLPIELQICVFEYSYAPIARNFPDYRKTKTVDHDYLVLSQDRNSWVLAEEPCSLKELLYVEVHEKLSHGSWGYMYTWTDPDMPDQYPDATDYMMEKHFHLPRDPRRL